MEWKKIATPVYRGVAWGTLAPMEFWILVEDRKRNGQYYYQNLQF